MNIRKVVDGLGRVWYEGWYEDSPIVHIIEWGRANCRHRFKWLTRLHVRSHRRLILSREFHDV